MQVNGKLLSPRELVALYETRMRLRRAIFDWRTIRERSPNTVGINIWTGPDLLREDEVAHCRILHWLLDPNAEHAQGTHLCASFLREVLAIRRAPRTIDFETRVNREFRVRDSRIDITIRWPGNFIGIEAKVRSPTTLRQLKRYREQAPSCDLFQGFILQISDGPIAIPKAELEYINFRAVSWRAVSDWLKRLSRELCPLATDRTPSFTNRVIVGFLMSNFAESIDRWYPIERNATNDAMQ